MEQPPAPPARADEPLAPPASTPFDTTAPPGLEPRVITALRVVGQNVQLDLPPDQERFTLGAAPPPVVDLTLDGDMVSRLHAVLVRKGAKLRVLDQGSTNGTFFRGHRDPDFEIAAGDVFEVSRRLTLLALDQPLSILRKRLLWVLGLRNHAGADLALQLVAANRPLLLLGPPGCEQRAIAEEIHRRSPFADRDFVVAPPSFASRADQDLVLTRGHRSTVYLDLAGSAAPLPHHFVSHLFADCRPIVAAPTRDRAAAVLDTFAHQLQPIPLATPSERPDDIPRLLDALVVQEHAEHGGGELLPLAALGEANVDALKAHPWPGHFNDLRRQVKRLHAVLTSGLRARAAARALGLRSVASLIEALDRLGVHLKLAEGDDLPLDDAGTEGELPTPPGRPTRSGPTTSPASLRQRTGRGR